MTGPIIVAIVIAVPLITIAILRGVLPRVSESQDLAIKRFVCPHCGKKFELKWQKIFFNRVSIYMYKSMKTKCPHCGVVDMCF